MRWKRVCNLGFGAIEFEEKRGEMERKGGTQEVWQGTQVLKKLEIITRLKESEKRGGDEEGHESNAYQSAAS